MLLFLLAARVPTRAHERSIRIIMRRSSHAPPARYKTKPPGTRVRRRY
ncbi:hypothetical protein [Burkholderia stagnalis]|nr:hypothetical protein [Burkholderia stagnalis]